MLRSKKNVRFLPMDFFFRMKSIRSLSLGKLTSTQISPEDFTDFGLELEDLKLTGSLINSIKSHAFKNVRGIRRLDLSENDISSIDNEAFTEVIETQSIDKPNRFGHM